LISSTEDRPSHLPCPAQMHRLRSLGTHVKPLNMVEAQALEETGVRSMRVREAETGFFFFVFCFLLLRSSDSLALREISPSFLFSGHGSPRPYPGPLRDAQHSTPRLRSHDGESSIRNSQLTDFIVTPDEIDQC
jgi:hypothetical protein